MMINTQPSPHPRFDELCRYIEAHADESLTLTALAERAGLSAAHFQRQFKAVVGVSPKQYQTACRLKQFKQQLKDGDSVIDASYAAGFGSSSRVYESLNTTLGMTPNQYRRGGQGLSISYASATLSIGTILLGATDRGLCFLQIGQPSTDLHRILQEEFPNAHLAPMHTSQLDLLHDWIHSLDAFLSGHLAQVQIPLDIHGTAFQQKVWQYLQTIPRGEVRSYSDVAQAIGQPKAARAVASACAANNIALLIPCHRVIRGDGQLSGYRWGVALKQTLLKHEQEDAS